MNHHIVHLTERLETDHFWHHFWDFLNCVFPQLPQTNVYIFLLSTPYTPINCHCFNNTDAVELQFIAASLYYTTNLYISEIATVDRCRKEQKSQYLPHFP